MRRAGFLMVAPRARADASGDAALRSPPTARPLSPHPFGSFRLQAGFDSSLNLLLALLGGAPLTGLEKRTSGPLQSPGITAADQRCSKGLSSATPNSWKSAPLRVTTVRLWTLAMAAIIASS